jgi:hypothetical protein
MAVFAKTRRSRSSQDVCEPWIINHPKRPKKKSPQFFAKPRPVWILIPHDTKIQRNKYTAPAETLLEEEKPHTTKNTSNNLFRFFRPFTAECNKSSVALTIIKFVWIALTCLVYTEFWSLFDKFSQFYLWAEFFGV